LSHIARWGIGPQGGNCAQELAPMADKGYAQISEVVSRQLAQDLGVYRVIVECGRVLFEPEPAQPRRYVHAVILGSEERHPPLDERALRVSAPIRARDAAAGPLLIAPIPEIHGPASICYTWSYAVH
jgi:hypothetical protein